MIVRRARHRLLPLLGLALIALAACQENLAGGAACPTLCPGQQLEVHDTVLVAAEIFDTSAIVNGMPPLGTETQLLVARYADAQGDSIVSGAVLRYDSLQQNFPATGLPRSRSFPSCRCAPRRCNSRRRRTPR